jgi:hypothetical protein
MKAILPLVILSLCLPVPILRCVEVARANEGTHVQKAIRPGGPLRNNHESERIRLAEQSGPVRTPVKDSSKPSYKQPSKTANPIKIEDLSGRLVERGKQKKKDK